MLLLVFSMCALASGKPTVVHGVVLDKHQNPLAQVKVGDISSASPPVYSDHDGHFAVLLNRGPLLLSLKAYDPLFVKVEPGQTIRATMTARGRPKQVPACRNAGHLGQRSIRLDVSEQFETSKHVDSDYEMLPIRIKGVPDSPELRFWKTVISSGMPNAQWFGDAVHISSEWIFLGDEQGLDVRIRTGSGKISRWVGWSQTLLEYREASATVASVFDRLITSACAQ